MNAQVSSKRLERLYLDYFWEHTVSRSFLEDVVKFSHKASAMFEFTTIGPGKRNKKKKKKKTKQNKKEKNRTERKKKKKKKKRKENFVKNRYFTKSEHEE